MKYERDTSTDCLILSRARDAWSAQIQVSSFYERPKSDVLSKHEISFSTDIAEGPPHAIVSFRASDFRAVASSHLLFCSRYLRPRRPGDHAPMGRS